MLLDCFPSVMDDDDDDDDDDNNHDNKEVREVCHVIAPCTHSGRCPMERYQYKKYKKSNRTQSNISGVEDVEEKGSDDENDSDKDDDKDKDKNTDKDMDHAKKEINDTNEGDDDVDDEQDSDAEEEELDGIRKGYCSFVHSIPGSGGGGRGEKFSYLVVQKRLSNNMGLVNISSNKTSTSNHHFDDVNIPSLLQSATTMTASVQTDLSQVVYSHESFLQEAIEIETRFLASDDDDLGLELVRDDQNRITYGRIVRAPKKHRGHVLIDTCEGPGKIVRSKIMRSLSKQIPGIYNASRKSRWGGFWPTVPNLQEK
jgi:ribosomal protein RSM22 (predicted rRNA methylase)